MNRALPISIIVVAVGVILACGCCCALGVLASMSGDVFTSAGGIAALPRSAVTSTSMPGHTRVPPPVSTPSATVPRATPTATPTATRRPTSTPTNSATPTSAAATPSAPTATPLPEPRRHHYAFAHLALPILFHEDPEWFIAILRREGLTFLQTAWDEVANTWEIAPADRLSSAGLAYEIREHDKMTIILITLPPPQAITEAYFVALVHCPEGNCPGSRPAAPTRVITLEYTLNLFNMDVPYQPNVLGEWTIDGSHNNYGRGPKPTLEAFFEAVLGLLE